MKLAIDKVKVTIISRIDIHRLALYTFLQHLMTHSLRELHSFYQNIILRIKSYSAIGKIFSFVKIH